MGSAHQDLKRAVLGGREGGGGQWVVGVGSEMAAKGGRGSPHPPWAYRGPRAR